ncbi:notch-regulated ankyrin repeat-containing protein-like [Tropilaelaps mercedesae]|uniref:Notch-regulated ankyrin repeat-containing protein-like n=1 Tax=Tropilaelaps mercedesae TaxID=418985 RepID=A0A1V9XAH8_9ACAR|nr:notch-regulated ankyrin repeat-containing protein-like [Tropilaelaps mercedesae]
MSPAASVAVSGPTIESSSTKKVDQILRSGDTKLLLKLLSDGELGHGVNVNVFDREGFTPLHKSVLDGNLELVKLLVKVGADIRLIVHSMAEDQQQQKNDYVD